MKSQDGSYLSLKASEEAKVSSCDCSSRAFEVTWDCHSWCSSSPWEFKAELPSVAFSNYGWTEGVWGLSCTAWYSNMMWNDLSLMAPYLGWCSLLEIQT